MLLLIPLSELCRKKAEALAEVNIRNNGIVDPIPDHCDLDDHTQSISSLLHSSTAGPTPTLPELRLSIDEWRSDWGPEGGWLMRFDESLRKAREKGLASTDRFFKECEIHAREGHRLLRLLRRLTSTTRSTQWGRQRDTYLQIFDLLEVVLAEVKFFEVKLDEYAPAVPYSKVSDARYYTKRDSESFTMRDGMAPALTMTALGKE
ncbi:hypothetical protein PISMIDRAFT_17939 [Pisolithus microcarpus 441]|uniref:Uncharacterized protein n=1 Tax=Pisolithus microcarpus 441 TaxID=765257 RepID=A0A0C9YID2_9AGAM|nr:hypothetical protein PISMIDRAFT_17939 [Pisolithus microcarpus 441]